MGNAHPAYFLIAYPQLIHSHTRCCCGFNQIKKKKQLPTINSMGEKKVTQTASSFLYLYIYIFFFSLYKSRGFTLAAAASQVCLRERKEQPPLLPPQPTPFRSRVERKEKKKEKKKKEILSIHTFIHRVSLARAQIDSTPAASGKCSWGAIEYREDG